ncbi:MAG: hypothetical protein AABZ60_02360 [Planctomycetota bacterium]
MEVDQTSLENLIRLSRLDRQIYEITEEKKDKPKKLSQEQKALQKLQGDYKKKEEDLKQKNLQIHQEELDLKEFADKIQKNDTRLNDVKSNKEYTAIRSEIANIKAESEIIEEKVLKKMEEADYLKEDLQELKQQIDKEEEKFKTKADRIQASLRHLEEQFSELKQKRTHLLANISKNIYAYYDRILERTQGKVVVPVKNAVCQGCFCGCTPQDENLLMIQKDLVVCKSCSRILCQISFYEQVQDA